MRHLLSLMKTKRLRPLVCFLLPLIGILSGSNTTVLAQVTPPDVSLDEVIFVHDQVALDRDMDGLKDNLEYILAENFKPLLVFDSDEKHRLPHEPVVLFQVRPIGCIGSGCATPWRVGITFVFLFRTDGGYGPSSWCKDAHNGDNQSARFYLESNNGQSWKLTSITNGNFTWPKTPVQWHQGTHAMIYMSAHKHHQYFSTANDGKDSPYSKPPSLLPSFSKCNDDVNGRGAQILPSLISSYSDQRYNNVGEPGAHSADYFIHSLDAFGYPGENAWSTKRFTGGLKDQGGTTSNESKWMKESFQFGNRFSTYRITPAAEAAYGPDTCLEGYVWREAVPGDRVCVTPETRTQAAYDNSQATVRRSPEGGAYGPDTCLEGYVWREAVPGDHVCVIPETRTQAAYDNSQAAARRVNS